MARIRHLSAGLLDPSTHVVAFHRLATKVEALGQPWGVVVGRLIRFRLARIWGCYIAGGAELGAVRLAHPTGLVIGRGAVIEDGVTIYQHVTLGASTIEGRVDDYPVVRARAIIYAGAILLGGIEIGEGAVVGAGSVVLHDVPPGGTVVGMPATAIELHR